MLSNYDFIRLSLELHLFFLRIMKEHSFFLQVGFTPKDSSFTRTANEFRMEFDKLLADVAAISDGNVSNTVINSGEVVTPYTKDAELLTSFYTGVSIPTNITQAESRITGSNSVAVNPILERRVISINNRAISLVQALINFKANILNNVLSCKMFTVNYPLLI